ncbi:peptidase C54, partial [Athelia psychrophila]
MPLSASSHLPTGVDEPPAIIEHRLSPTPLEAARIAVRFLLDSDAQPDRCTDPIWIMGVQHPGYESPPQTSPISPTPKSNLAKDGRERERDPAAHWPPIFYQDFTSRIWLTYRSQFAPIRDASLAALAPPSLNPPLPPPPPIAESGEGGVGEGRLWDMFLAGGGGVRRAWIPISGVGAEKGWTSDTGWGCMHRTGQSLLANALVCVHLGREWRRPPHPLPTAEYATYVQILTWFLDTPAPQAPFSVHRMALAGKELGTDVGCWFGPSVAAGAMRTLVNAFPDAHLGVAVATDGCLYQSEVFAASLPPVSVSHTASPRHDQHEQTSVWGGRAVLVLVGLRLGIADVNPIYYETIKALFAFPQSVGIAGGRPSSSYYFVGSQADSLFYLDPHHVRPAVPFRAPPHPRSPGALATGPVSPVPLQKQVSTSSASTSSLLRSPGSDREDDKDTASGRLPSQAPARGPGLDAVQEHRINAYSTAELKTFHCEHVRKLPLSGLDPSMLLGFLCRDEKEWADFRRRVSDV